MRKRWRMALGALILLPALFLLGSCGLLEPAYWSRLLPDFGTGGSSSAPAPAENAGTLTEILSQLLDREKPEDGGEVRGVWLSYLDLSPLLVGKTEEEFAASAAQIAENAAELGLNTLYVQVRPFSDSFYPSEYYPWSSWASGELGQPLSFDPIRMLRDEAARQNLSFHIWINPMRGFAEQEIGLVPESFPIRRWYDDPALREQNLLFSEGVIYLNPASAQARELIASGAVEALARYEADGVHIDDYFYPPKLSLEEDAASYRQYLEEGGSLSQEDWRRENTWLMVKTLGEAVHAADAAAQFGVSPRGVSSQNYNDLYIDIARWLEEPGLLDYIAPQLYFGFAHDTAPFDRAAEEWNALAEQYGVPLLIGLAAYKAGTEDPYAGSGAGEWLENPGLLAEQILFARELPAYDGVILFRYGSLFDGGIPAAAEEAKEALAPLWAEPAS